MRLVSIEMIDYKRFLDAVQINLDSKVVCVVGPNEAGKTSILDAIESLGNKDSIPEYHQSREQPSSDGHVAITGRFLLSSTEIQSIRHLYEVPPERVWMIAEKTWSGWVGIELDPQPLRPREPRRRVQNELVRLMRSPAVAKAFVPDELPQSLDDLEQLGDIQEAVGVLSENQDELSESGLRNLARVVEWLESLNTLPKYAARTLASAKALIQEEFEESPREAAKGLVEHLLPQALPFDDESRTLNEVYNLDEVASAPPKSLKNLAGVAELSLIELQQAASRNDTVAISDLIEDANGRLREQFSSWSQSPVRPEFHKGDGSQLHIHAREEGVKGSRTNFNERSAGLRAFVGLVAFVIENSKRANLILLVDEAEQHLHYEAQADLVKVFLKQEAVGQVIYTTHSAGCLPEDLGGGIRVVRPIQGSSASEVLNKFWTEEPGLTPLLLGMGASTLAFFPTRNAVVCEGPSELIMLGRILREATGKVELDFQIVPGSANAGSSRISQLDDEGPGVAWLVDGDLGGRRIKKKLKKNKIEEARIVPLGGSHESGYVMEDLLSPESYAAAVNGELTLRNSRSRVDESLFRGKRNYPKVLKTWCKENGEPEIGKTAIANLVVHQPSDKTILNPRRRKVAQRVYRDLTKVIRASGDPEA